MGLSININMLKGQHIFSMAGTARGDIIGKEEKTNWKRGCRTKNNEGTCVRLRSSFFFLPHQGRIRFCALILDFDEK